MYWSKVLDRVESGRGRNPSAPGELVRVQRVQVPQEGKANHHFHREPCVGHREVSGEASVAACAGRAIEPRNCLRRMRRDP